jgi:hypothetical protein
VTCPPKTSPSELPESTSLEVPQGSRTNPMSQPPDRRPVRSLRFCLSYSKPATASESPMRLNWPGLWSQMVPMQVSVCCRPAILASHLPPRLDLPCTVWGFSLGRDPQA